MVGFLNISIILWLEATACIIYETILRTYPIQQCKPFHSWILQTTDDGVQLIRRDLMLLNKLLDWKVGHYVLIDNM